MSLSGNKGEWSEVYTLFRLLAVGKLYAADKLLNKKEEVFYDIIRIIREENIGKLHFDINKEIQTVSIYKKEESRKILLQELSKGEFEKQADLLLERIKNSGKGVFEIPDIENFMSSICCSKIKAPSANKSDIKLRYFDSRNGSMPKVGFSIKSQLGSPSTLLNAGRTTNFTYKLNGISDLKMDKFNESKEGFKAKFSILDCFQFIDIDSLDYSYQFIDIDNKVFKNNLILIDGDLPKICASLLLQHYVFGNTRLSRAIQEVTSINPCGYDIQGGSPFYEYKIKRLLMASALGMIPSKPWNGGDHASGGYIIVKEDGEVLCYHLYNRNDFESYLLDNTKFETGKREKHGFGYIYKENGAYFIKLNLQIRFIK